MYAIRPDGVEVELHGDGTWTEVSISDFDDHPTDYSDATWVSDYDFDRRTITLTRAGARGSGGWLLNEIVRDDALSDPDGRFEVFVVAKDGWRLGDPGLISGEIVKVAAQLRNDGYLAAWRADFLEDPIICDGMLWARYMHGGLHLGREENHMFRHWTYASHGEILRTPTKVLPTWTAAHDQWTGRRRRQLWTSVRAMSSDGFRVELHGDGTWTRITVADFGNYLTASSDAEWVSEYDFDRRMVTVTRVVTNGTSAWPLNEIVLDAELSDPDGRFEVFVAPEKGVVPYGTSELPPGEIVKVAARLDDDGYFTAWHPDFCQDPIICEGTLWGIYYGGYQGYGTGPMPRHWVYVTHGHIINRQLTELRTWADAHGEWLEWRRSLRDT
jgi:hypothetical protein